jgi:two-component system sensor histidine kinase RstB
MFLWVSPLWKDLSKLNIIATNFGDGALDERAKITKKSTVSSLAVSFNQMADKIESLFSSQKQLTRAIAHDLRTPLYRLRFAFEMVRSDDASKEEKATYFEAIDTSINDLDQLINQTLLLSRYTSAVDLTNFNLTNLAQKIQYEIDCFALEINDIGIDFSANSSLLDLEVYIDKRAMIRAINNLIVNASHYATSKISIQFYQDNTDYFICVEDDGLGIPSSEWEDVFIPFKQIDNEQRDSNSGYGLGLAIVKQIMQLHNGEVILSDSSLGGAKFLLSWPITKQ